MKGGKMFFLMEWLAKLFYGKDYDKHKNVKFKTNRRR
tara:strand:- start:106 stop:216 length:111 start_codon:yes stop_codon:yes gene_type:complete